MKNHDRSILDGCVPLKSEDVPSVKQLRQAALRLYKDALLYAKTFRGEKEGFSFNDLNAVAGFLEFLIEHVERFKTEDKISELDVKNSTEVNKKKRLCSVCKTGHVDYEEEVEAILRLADDIKSR
jgi:hypothetical protein